MGWENGACSQKPISISRPAKSLHVGSGGHNPDTRAKINEALLRYCELDTLAMVMIVQAWRDFLETTV